MVRWIQIAAIASLALSACEAEETPPAPDAGSVSPERAAELYADHCAICHGARGDGHGPRHASLFRKPRNFRDPRWKASQSADQLRAAIRDGVPGTDMPSWRQLGEDKIAALVDHVRRFGNEPETGG